MTTTEAIIRHLESLSSSAQTEVLDFAEFLHSQRESRAAREEDLSWSDLSLGSAVRGMEDEEILYTEADLKETFK